MGPSLDQLEYFKLRANRRAYGKVIMDQIDGLAPELVMGCGGGLDRADRAGILPDYCALQRNWAVRPNGLC